MVRRGVEEELHVGHRLPAVVGARARSSGFRSPCGRRRPPGRDARSRARPASGSARWRPAPARVEAGIDPGPGRLEARHRRRRARCAAAWSIRAVSARLAARSMCIPSSDAPVEATIWVSPAASAGIAAGDGVGIARALQEDDPLEGRRIDPAPATAAVDLATGTRPPAPPWRGRRPGSWRTGRGPPRRWRGWRSRPPGPGCRRRGRRSVPAGPTPGRGSGGAPPP